MGLPCAYKIQERLNENAVLTLEDIHPHWHFNHLHPAVLLPLILESAIDQVRGRRSIQEQESHRCPLNQVARSRLTASNTRRDPLDSNEQFFLSANELEA